MRIAIVGAGVVGLSTAWALSRLGKEAIVFDQSLIPNPDSASFDQHRLIRSFYGDQPGYCLMVDEAYEAWDRLWADLGESHYAEAGTLAIAMAPGDWADQSRRTMDRLGKGYRILSRAEVESLCPYLKLTDDSQGLYTESGGLLFADRIVTALADYLAATGVALRPESRITSIDRESGGLTLEDGTQETFDAILVTAGAWTGKLLPDAVEAVVPRRQVVAYLEPPERFRDAWQRSPVLVHMQDDTDLYAAPPLRGTGLKVGCALHRRPGDPDDPRVLEPDEPAAVASYFAGQFKDFADYRPLAGRVCYYGWNPTGRFVARQNGCVLSLTGCTGHMFKFGALMGERLAATVTGALAAETFIDWAAGQETANVAAE